MTGGYGVGPYGVGPYGTSGSTDEPDTPPVNPPAPTGPQLRFEGWRYILQTWSRASGWVMRDLNFKLTGVSIQRVLSGVNQMSGTIPMEVSGLMDDDGNSIITPWACAVWAERDGKIYGGGIVKSVDLEGQTATLSTIGKVGYAWGQGFENSKLFVQTDPLDIVRYIYTYLQSRPGGNIELEVDTTQSPVKIGTTLVVDTSQTPSGDLTLESGPYRLSWYDTDDLGDSINDLSSSTPFDYVEDTSWVDSTRREVRSFMRLGYPSIGRRLLGEFAPVFALGENVTAAWQYSDDGENFASDVFVRGKGEGRVAIHATASAALANKLRRLVVIDEKRANTTKLAMAVAQVQLQNRSAAGEISSISVKPHKNAPIGSYDVGDQIQLVSPKKGWKAATAQWHRIMSITYNPDAGDVAVLELKAVEKTIRWPIATTIVGNP